MFQASITYLHSTSNLDSMYATINQIGKLSKSNEGEEAEFDSRLNGVKEQGKESELSDEEKKYLEKLKKRDKEVRRHEQAHKSSAGNLAVGAPNYEYKIGPDGKRYAVGGNVRIDTSKVQDDPEATIEKAKKIKQAALAPADPSPKDRQVAAAATKLEQQARLELQKGEKEDDTSSNKNELEKISSKYSLDHKNLQDPHKNYNYSGEKKDYPFEVYGKLNLVI
ncbi:MAG: putative metalloprotease CJM1_0395 family protein [Rhodothermaceae bacterium]